MNLLKNYKFIAIASVVALLLGAAIMVSTGLYNKQDGLLSGPTASPTVPVVTPTQNSPINNTTNTTATLVPKSCYTLLFFEMPNCPYCTVMQPKVEAWAQAHSNRVTLKIYNTWVDSNEAAHYGVRSTPTTIVVNAQGTALKTWVGEFDTNEMTVWLNVH